MLNVTFDNSGFGRFERNLEALGAQESVSFAELFPPAFMRARTRYPTFEALLEASGYTLEAPEDFAAIPDLEWDEFIRVNTSFRTWLEMQQVAVVEWAKRRLSCP